MLGLLGAFFVVFSFVSIALSLFTQHNFLKRDFKNYHEKNKWGKFVFNSFIGRLKYLYHFFIRKG
jgi:hypothetical protein